MAYGRSPRIQKIDRKASRATLDPVARLAAGIVKQAAVDLIGADPVKRLDAGLWFAAPGAADLIQFAGLEVNPLVWLTHGGTKRAKRRIKEIGDE